MDGWSTYKLFWQGCMRNSYQSLWWLVIWRNAGQSILTQLLARLATAKRVATDWMISDDVHFTWVVCMACGRWPLYLILLSFCLWRDRDNHQACLHASIVSHAVVWLLYILWLLVSLVGLLGVAVLSLRYSQCLINVSPKSMTHSSSSLLSFSLRW